MNKSDTVKKSAGKPRAGRNGNKLSLYAKVSPTSKLEVLKKQRFNSTGKAERIARSLAALNQATSIQLTSEEWRQLAEDLGSLAI